MNPCLPATKCECKPEKPLWHFDRENCRAVHRINAPEHNHRAGEDGEKIDRKCVPREIHRLAAFGAVVEGEEDRKFNNDEYDRADERDNECRHAERVARTRLPLLRTRVGEMRTIFPVPPLSKVLLVHRLSARRMLN